MTRRAPALAWFTDHGAAVTEAVRMTAALRTHDRDAPPYRVRKRLDGRHNLWRVYSPYGQVPGRRNA
jgi:hypothetical protein